MEELCIFRISPNFQLGFGNFLALTAKSVGVLSFNIPSWVGSHSYHSGVLR